MFVLQVMVGSTSLAASLSMVVPCRMLFGNESWNWHTRAYGHVTSQDSSVFHTAVSAKFSAGQCKYRCKRMKVHIHALGFFTSISYIQELMASCYYIMMLIIHWVFFCHLTLFSLYNVHCPPSIICAFLACNSHMSFVNAPALNFVYSYEKNIDWRNHITSAACNRKEFFGGIVKHNAFIL